MGKPANKTAVGAFVLGALAVAITSLLVVGSGKFSSKKSLKYEVYFAGSVKGLQVGAPVLFRGVRIGEVKSISLRMNAQDLSWVLPVELEVDPARFEVVGGQVQPTDQSYLKSLIAKGLRAQLQPSSLLTGQLAVYLDFFPQGPARFVAPEGSNPPEIPSVRTEIEELAHRLQELPVQDIAAHLDRSLVGFSRLVESPDLAAGITSGREFFDRANKVLDQNANLSHELSQTLQATEATMRSLQSLADYLSRHPESLIRGKHPVKGE
jgi:paraquat-inducible protein B